MRRHHAAEPVGGGPGFQRLFDAFGTILGICGDATQGQRLAAQSHGDVPQGRVDGGAGQGFHDLGNLQRVACGGGERLAHVGDQGGGHATGTLGGGDQGAGEGLGIGHGFHERTGAAFDIQNQGFQTGGEFLGQDRGGDQVDALDRAGDVADGIQAAVGGGDLG